MLYVICCCGRAAPTRLNADAGAYLWLRRSSSFAVMYRHDMFAHSCRVPLSFLPSPNARVPLFVCESCERLPREAAPVLAIGCGLPSASHLQASLRLPIGRVLSWTPETTNTATRRRCAKRKQRWLEEEARPRRSASRLKRRRRASFIDEAMKACGHLRGSSATRTRTRQLMTLMEITLQRRRGRGRGRGRRRGRRRDARS